MKKTRIAALLLAFMMIFSLAGCADTTNSLTVEGVEFSAGLYRAHMISAYSTAQSKLENTKESMWKQKIDGKDAVTFIEEETIAYCKQYVGTEKKFEELKLTLTEEEIAAAKNQAAMMYQYYGQMYEQNGVGLVSLEKVAINDAKYNKIFEKLYHKGGTKEVAESSINDYMKENYLGLKYISLDATDKDGKKLTGDAYNKAKAKMEKYLEKAKSGTAFNTIIQEFQKAEAEEKKEPVPDFTDKKEKDYYNVIRKDSKSPSEKFVSAVAKSKIDEPFLLEDDKALYVVVRLDVLTLKDSIEDLSKVAIKDLKSEEFSKDMKEFSKGYAVTKNEASLRKYGPKKIKMS